MITSPGELYDKIVQVTTPQQRSNWCSDLYVKGTPAVERLIEDYQYGHQCFPFIDRIDHELWYTIPFAYSPYWEGKVKC